MTRLRTFLAAALASMALFAACSPAPSAPPIAAAPAVPAAALEVTAKGRVPTLSPFGLEASFVVKPADWAPDDKWASEPDADWYRFAVDFDAAGTNWAVAGHPLRLPTAIVPGRYRVGAVANILSDVSSPGFSQWPILGTSAKCLADLVVEPATTNVDIVVNFGDAGCSIKVTSR
ncbi:MAG: hypothetical protein ACJ77B_07425 [Chloroflexota bacterium]